MVSNMHLTCSSAYKRSVDVPLTGKSTSNYRGRIDRISDDVGPRQTRYNRVQLDLHCGNFLDESQQEITD